LVSQYDILTLRKHRVSTFLDGQNLRIRWNGQPKNEKILRNLVEIKAGLVAEFERDRLPVQMVNLHTAVFSLEGCEFLNRLLSHHVSEVAYTDHTSGTGGVLVFRSERTGMYLFSKQEAQQCEGFKLLGRLAALVLTSGDVLRL
jgi:hypothetical protein